MIVQCEDLTLFNISWRFQYNLFSKHVCLYFTRGKMYMKDTLETRAIETKCPEPTAEERAKYELVAGPEPGRCCLSYTRVACLMDGVALPVSHQLTAIDSSG